MAIDVTQFIHALDSKGMAAMEATPGFGLVTNAVMKLYDERLFHGMNMASKVRLGPDQLPQIYRLLREVCDRLEMEVEPELCLENGRSDAYSRGDKRPFIVLQSGLINCLTMQEIKSVLACMCGHIICRHNRYETMARIILDAGESLLGIAKSMMMPVYWAIMAWLRCAGFTADRIDAYVMESADVVVSKLMKMKGSSTTTTICTSIRKRIFARRRTIPRSLRFPRSKRWSRIGTFATRRIPFPSYVALKSRSGLMTAVWTMYSPKKTERKGNGRTCRFFKDYGRKSGHEPGA